MYLWSGGNDRTQDGLDDIQGMHAKIPEWKPSLPVIVGRGTAGVRRRRLAPEVVDRQHIANRAGVHELQPPADERVQEQRMADRDVSATSVRRLDEAVAILDRRRQRLLHIAM